MVLVVLTLVLHALDFDVDMGWVWLILAIWGGIVALQFLQAMYPLVRAAVRSVPGWPRALWNSLAPRGKSSDD